MGIVIVDGQEIEVADHERLNGIQVARRAGADVPHYCWHPGLTVVASCRMCLVETGTRNPETGQITMMPKVVPACQTPAKDGTVFVTNSDKVKQARAFVEEALLLDHPIDCPICDKAGECLLQDYHFAHGQQERRADLRPFTSKRRDMGPTVTLFADRCVMCSRCVRFTREVTGTAELMVIERGSHEEIDVVPGFPLENKLSGNVVDLCPVGALGDKDFLYQQRVWFMKNHAHVCAGCSSGCSIWVDENQDHVYRLRPRENQAVNQWWICDEGRYGYHHVHDEHRLVEPQRRDKEQYVTADWASVPGELKQKLGKAGRIAAVLSPNLTVEEAYLLALLVRKLDPQAELALGPVPVAGSDEKFRGGFTIRAEKCPNRRGVEEIIRHFTGRVLAFADLLPRLESGEFGAVWVTGGYKRDWIDEATANRVAKTPLVIVQDMFASPLWQRATYRLPGVAFAERDGSYVNATNHLQSFRWAVRPPVGARIEGSIYAQLLGRTGMYNSRAVLSEIAGEVAYFAAAADGVPPQGVALAAREPAGV
ncbi:MAG: molybdopterin-dependent oxidoreductase [Pirellulales bacterium]|nr:molybdopterin-dependent oxidoreductase [Pirellulales bacterium]